MDELGAWLMGLILGFILGLFAMSLQMHGTAIEHGAAYYHPETAQFTWK